MLRVVSITTGSASEDTVTQLVAWMELACSLLESLATHAFRWNEVDFDRFRHGLIESLNLLKDQPSPASVLVTIGALSQRIEHYHQNVRQMVDDLISELHGIIRVLMSSMDQVQLEAEDSVRALHEIEETIGKTSTAEELRIAKVHLVRALKDLADKTHERRQRSSELLINLQERVLTLETVLRRGRRTHGREVAEAIPKPTAASSSGRSRGAADRSGGIQESLSPLR